MYKQERESREAVLIWSLILMMWCACVLFGSVSYYCIQIVNNPDSSAAEVNLCTRSQFSEV